MTGRAILAARLQEHLAMFLHASVAANPTEAARHAMFIGTRMTTSVLVIAAAPLFLAIHGAPQLWHVLAFVWMVMPLAGVALVSRTGAIVPAQIICVVSLFCLTLTFGIGGGLGVAVSWLLLVPVEAALTMNALAIVLSSGLTVTTACFLYLAQVNGWLPEAYAVSPVQRIGLLLPGIIYGAMLAQFAVATHNLLRKAELIGAARLQSLSEAIGDLVMRHDRQGNVLHANAQCSNTFGLFAHELLGRGFFEHVHVADRPAFLKTIADAATQGETLTATLRIRTGTRHHDNAVDGNPTFIWVEVRARQIPLDARISSREGASASVLVVVRDVDMRMQHEEGLKIARIKAEQASVWKDRFLANVSHELRTPLNAIIGFSEMLGSESLSPKEAIKQREYAQIIHESGMHLLSVVNTILDMSKIEAGSFELMPEPFELVPLVSQCCDILSLRAKQGDVELVRDCPGNLEEIIADKRACKQILLNLLSNAVKFTRPGGRVIISVRPEGNSLKICVADTGIGILASDLPRLGDPFFQATASYDRAYEGTGLGLSVVRGLVGLHGGDIQIESAQHIGTSVCVRLPLDCRHAVRQPATISTIPRIGPAMASPISLQNLGMKKSA